MIALKFESRLASRISHKESGYKGALAIAGAIFMVFLILNVTSGSIAGQQAVVQLGSKSSVAKYLGQFDGKSGVMMLGARSSIDWVCVKMPFKGHLSDIQSISFSEFVVQTGGVDALEPYIILKLTVGRTLICNPVSSYSNGTWDLPLMEWQLRDAASKGDWSYVTPDAKSNAAPLITWIRMIGNSNVQSVSVFIGRWSIDQPYQCYVGDICINGERVDLSNAARIKGSATDLPPGF